MSPLEETGDPERKALESEIMWSKMMEGFGNGVLHGGFFCWGVSVLWWVGVTLG